MADAMSGPVTVCPWCSAPLPDAGAERCPSCDAVLSAAPVDGEIRGVTALDPEAILRARSEVSRPRNRILSFITGEVATDTGAPVSPESLAPPADDVRREMLRLQLEAERADLEAETVAMKADELAKIGIPLSELAAQDQAPAPTAEAPSAEAPVGPDDVPAPDAPPPPPAPQVAAEPVAQEPPAPA